MFPNHLNFYFNYKISGDTSANIQLSTDATRMSQAFSGSGYIQQIIMAEISEFLQHQRGLASTPVGIKG